MSATSPNLRPFGSGDTDDVTAQSRAHAVDRGHSFFQRLIATDATWHAMIARVTLGLIMLPHALQKVSTLFGGYGFSGTYGAFTKMGIPGPIAAFAIVAELFGALALTFGVLTRVGALAIIGMMLGAIALTHLPHGFFMNWYGQKAGEGFEYHLLAIGLAVTVLITGAGRVSIDRLLMKWRPAEGGSVSPALTATP